MIGKQLKLASAGLLTAILIMPTLAAGSLHVIRMTDHSDIPGLKYNCAYPRLAGIQDNEQQDQVNVRFKEMAVSAKKSAELAAKRTPGKELSGNYDFSVKRDRSGLLSIKLNETLTGAGQPQIDCSGLTIDTVSGAIYQLGDLFFDNADYVSMISENVGKQISQRGLDKKLLRNFKTIRRNEDYYLTDDELVIILKSNYFPSDMAVQEFPIKLKSLEGSLKPSLRLST